MKTTLQLIILSAFIMTAACKGKKVTNEQTSDASVNKEAGIAMHTTDNEKTNVIPAARTATEWQNDLARFAFRLFGLQSENAKGKGFCISPASLQIALGMTYVGARTLTAQQMAEVLGFSEDMAQFLDETGKYYASLKGYEKDTLLEFSTANRIYVEQTYPLLEEYMTALRTYFGGAFEPADFINNASEAEDRINEWVETNTRKRIKQLIPKDLLDRSTLMVLVNAMYFKADWKIAFDESKSVKKPFYNSAGKSVERMFMTEEFTHVRYADYRKWQILEIPYKTPGFSFLVVLPKGSASENIHTLIPGADDYAQILAQLRTIKVNVEIPSFKIESSFQLEDKMSDMGMPLAFSNLADFSGISGRQDIKISKILQKVFFEINEKGSEAAAATAVVMVRTSSVTPEPEPVVRFIANRPFIFILKENTYQTPLFIGQFTGNE